MSYLFGLFVLTIAFSFCDNSYSVEDYGSPRGLMSVCPGSTKPAEIPRSQLKFLTFVVHSTSGRKKRYTYWNSRSMAKDRGLNFKKKTMVILLGYLDSSNFMIASLFANEYLSKGFNVIVVDNQRFATVHYYLASRLMRPVGKHIGEVLAELVHSGMDPEMVELFGFSLGGQTVSYVAKTFRNLTGRNISAITALEPSGPCFRFLGPEDRLDASDADFVQVVHTNIDGFGMATRSGHVDFYVNGGEYQPSYVDIYPCTTTCSHFRVIPLWLSAMKNPKQFIAIKCDNVGQARRCECYDRSPLVINLMGLEVDRGKHGVYYLSTSQGYPYFLGKNGMKEEFVSWRHITDVNDGNETEIYT